MAISLALCMWSMYYNAWSVAKCLDKNNQTTPPMILYIENKKKPPVWQKFNKEKLHIRVHFYVHAMMLVSLVCVFCPWIKLSGRMHFFICVLCCSLSLLFSTIFGAATFFCCFFYQLLCCCWFCDKIENEKKNMQLKKTAHTLTHLPAMAILMHANGMNNIDICDLLWCGWDG